MSFVVMKFGGSSVASLEGWQTILERIGKVKREGHIPVVVCSALGGVSDLLEKAVALAPLDSHHEVLADITARHEALADAMGVSYESFSGELDTLRRLLAGAALLGEVSERLRARVLARGELMSTRLGHAWLIAQGERVAWKDTRNVLVSEDAKGLSAARHYLNAHVEAHEDAVVQAEWSELPAVIVQGFIAKDPQAHTVLLGRGGSDTAAALFAARLHAARCEIWSDVPGIFSANPREVPSARLLTHLSYEVAQEIAAMGAKVLHPRSLAPCQQHEIPMWLRWTQRPDAEGTRIDAQASEDRSEVAAISARHGVKMVTVETINMWQEVGFLARLFTIFSQHGLSVDMLSSGQSSVSVSLDLTPEAEEPERMEALLADLSQLGTARVVHPVAAVSLVGQKMRGLLHRLGPALEVFEEQPVHMMCQSSSDRNLTFLVEQDEAERLVARLHALLIDADDAPGRGPTWNELFDVSGRNLPDAWWPAKAPALLEQAALGTPTYVYDSETIRQRARQVKGLKSIDRAFYAIKANPHPEVLRLLAEEGMGFECVSPGEIQRVLESVPGIDPKNILYTPNFASREDLVAGIEAGVNVTLDHYGPLQTWPEIFDGVRLILRIDPGEGRGHHEHVRTGGSRSKFGIHPGDLPMVIELAEMNGATVVGLHAHAGSGIREPSHWGKMTTLLLDLAAQFPTVEHVDVGGGLGVPTKPDETPLPMDTLDEAIASARAAHPEIAVWTEPGRFLVAESGVLLATVSQVKAKGPRTFVGTDAGMHTLMRPALYGAWHGIHHLSKLDAPHAMVADIVGPICESADVMGRSRPLPETEAGDVLLVELAGAYGASMANEYNLRGLPREVII